MHMLDRSLYACIAPSKPSTQALYSTPVPALACPNTYLHATQPGTQHGNLQCWHRTSEPEPADPGPCAQPGAESARSIGDSPVANAAPRRCEGARNSE